MTSMTTTVLPASYYRVVGAAGFSNLADGVRLAAMPLLAWQLTGSVLGVSTVFVVGQLPSAVFGLSAGQLVDSVDRRRLIQWVGAARTLVLVGLAALILTDAVFLGVLLLSTFLLGVGEVLADLASSALVPQLVPDEHLERANSGMVGAEILGNEFVGPAVGAWLFAVGAWLPFMTNATLACRYGSCGLGPSGLVS